MCVVSIYCKMYGDGYNLKIKVYFYVYYCVGYIYLLSLKKYNIFSLMYYYF